MKETDPTAEHSGLMLRFYAQALTRVMRTKAIFKTLHDLALVSWSTHAAALRRLATSQVATPSTGKAHFNSSSVILRI